MPLDKPLSLKIAGLLPRRTNLAQSSGAVSAGVSHQTRSKARYAASVGYFQTPWHIVLLLLIALLLFGGKRLPEIGKSLGHGMREFKDAVTGNSEPDPSRSPSSRRPSRRPSPRRRRRPSPRPSARPSSQGMAGLPRRLGHAEEATLGEHLEELRGRLFVMLGAIALGTIVAFVFHNDVLNWLNRPLPANHHRLAAFGVAEPFTVTITVSLYAGLVLALPVVLWQIWLFFAPAVDPAAERKVLGSRHLRRRARRGRDRLRLLDPAPAGRPLPHELRQRALPAPDPCDVVLQLRRHGPRRDRARFPDAARRARARRPRRPQLADSACSPEDGLPDHRGDRPRAARPGSRDDVPGAPADVAALRGVDLGRGDLRARGAQDRPSLGYSGRLMARAAVKAKQQATAKAQASARARARGRRKHSGGGNPNQDLFFTRLRRRQKWVYMRPRDHLRGHVRRRRRRLRLGRRARPALLGIFGGSGDQVSKAKDEIKKNPAKGYIDLARAYEAKSQQAQAVSALQSYLALKKKNANVWQELGGIQMAQAQTLATQYQDAQQAARWPTRATAFQPTGALATATGANPVFSHRRAGCDDPELDPLHEGDDRAVLRRQRLPEGDEARAPQPDVRSSSMRRRRRTPATTRSPSRPGRSSSSSIRPTRRSRRSSRRSRSSSRQRRRPRRLPGADAAEGQNRRLVRRLRLRPRG